MEGTELTEKGVGQNWRRKKSEYSEYIVSIPPLYVCEIIER